MVFHIHPLHQAPPPLEIFLFIDWLILEDCGTGFLKNYWSVQYPQEGLHGSGWRASWLMSALEIRVLAVTFFHSVIRKEIWEISDVP